MASGALLGVAAQGRCPPCGAPTLFASVIGFAERCGNCGLDFRRFNVGDGPAAFLILILGAIIVGLAMWVELSFEQPAWVHLLLWPPFVILGTVGALRLSKAPLLGLEYRHQAAEGSLDERP